MYLLHLLWLLCNHGGHQIKVLVLLQHQDQLQTNHNPDPPFLHLPLKDYLHLLRHYTAAEIINPSLPCIT